MADRTPSQSAGRSPSRSSRSSVHSRVDAEPESTLPTEAPPVAAAVTQNDEDQQAAPARGGVRNGTKMFMRDVPPNTTRDDVVKAFDEETGKNVRNVWIAHNPPGFGFFWYDGDASALMSQYATVPVGAGVVKLEISTNQGGKTQRAAPPQGAGRGMGHRAEAGMGYVRRDDRRDDRVFRRDERHVDERAFRHDDRRDYSRRDDRDDRRDFGWEPRRDDRRADDRGFRPHRGDERGFRRDDRRDDRLDVRRDDRPDIRRDDRPDIRRDDRRDVRRDDRPDIRRDDRPDIRRDDRPDIRRDDRPDIRRDDRPDIRRDDRPDIRRDDRPDIIRRDDRPDIRRDDRSDLRRRDDRPRDRRDDRQHPPREV